MPNRLTAGLWRGAQALLAVALCFVLGASVARAEGEDVSGPDGHGLERDDAPAGDGAAHGDDAAHGAEADHGGGHGGGGGGGHHPTPEQLNELRIIQFLGFGILFAILWVFAFPVAGKYFRERSEGIAATFQEAQDRQAAAIKATDDAKAKLADFENSTVARKEAAVKEGAALKQVLLEEADQLVSRIRHKAKVEAEVERAKTMLSCQNVFSQTAFEVAEEVLGSTMTKTTHNALVDKFLSELDMMGA